MSEIIYFSCVVKNFDHSNILYKIGYNELYMPPRVLVIDGTYIMVSFQSNIDKKQICQAILVNNKEFASLMEKSLLMAVKSMS